MGSALGLRLSEGLTESYTQGEYEQLTGQELAGVPASTTPRDQLGQLLLPVNFQEGPHHLLQDQVEGVAPPGLEQS